MANPNARARASADPVEASKAQSNDNGYRSISAVLGSTTPAAPPPIPSIDPAPAALEAEPELGVLPVELPPSKKYKVVGTKDVRLNGIKVHLVAGKIIDTNAYGADIVDKLYEQGVALEDYVA